jgi:hypothetical protein
VTVDGRVLLDCGLPEASRPVYKGGGGGSGATQAFLPFCALRNPSILKPLARSPAFLLSFIRDLARVKQTAHRRRRYVAMPSSSSSAAVRHWSNRRPKILSVIWWRWSCTRATWRNLVFRGSPRPACKTCNSWGTLGVELDELRGRKRFRSRRVSWWCSRHFLLLAYGYMHIILWRRCCRGMKCRFIS